MITLQRYSPDFKPFWDDFVKRSKNGTFLHLRDYMDYHADRFQDFSLIILRDGKLHSLFPACAMGNEWVSHAGLTYGGMIMDGKATAEETLEIFQAVVAFLSKEGFNSIRYSPSPHIYHRLPAEEDLYALFRAGGILSGRKISSVIEQANPLKWRNIRKSGVKKALAEGIVLERSDDFKGFWNILTNNLAKRYSALPVHSLEEIERLHSLFPQNIVLHTASVGEEILAGVVMYITHKVAHTQYISANARGKQTGALDLLFHHLISEAYHDKPYFDFGTSTEAGGHYLNESLIYQKEGFGARAVCYDTYTLPLH